MRSKMWVLLIGLIFVVLSACGEKELPMLEVEFELPEFADVGDTIELKAVVTYDNKPVKDAKEVDFEYWENDAKDESITLKSTNHKDGIYTAEITFENDAVYSIYAHTTAEGLHTMPLRSIIVGDPDLSINNNEEHSDHADTDGFGMHFMNPENSKKDDVTVLIVHLNMGDDAFENADVRYEIWNDDISETHDWVDADESTPGEYVANHTFPESGTYTVQIHVENDDGLHEHEEYDIVVAE